jgi:hypothetical protein
MTYTRSKLKIDRVLISTKSINMGQDREFTHTQTVEQVEQ